MANSLSQIAYYRQFDSSLKTREPRAAAPLSSNQLTEKWQFVGKYLLSWKRLGYLPIDKVGK